MPRVSLAEKIAYLADGRAFADRPASVETIETHFAWIFLSSELAYKLKKPIRFGAIDFRRMEARHAYCELEVSLNRRLAEATYLRVVPLVLSTGGLCLDGAGETVDWLVEMRRLPSGYALDERSPEDIGDVDVARVMRKLVGFYAHTPAAPWDAAGYLHALTRFSRRHLEQRASLGSEDGIPPGTLDRIVGLQLAFIESHRELLAQRAAEGRVVDAHGDLRPEHVFLTEPPQIIDCLEFSIDLRWLDAAEEVAFLALECDRHGLGGVGQRLLAAYRKVAGDGVDECLLGFYRSRRALARAMLAALRAAEGRSDADAWRARARWYLAAAEAGIAAGGEDGRSLADDGDDSSVAGDQNGS